MDAGRPLRMYEAVTGLRVAERCSLQARDDGWEPDKRGGRRSKPVYSPPVALPVA